MTGVRPARFGDSPHLCRRGHTDAYHDAADFGLAWANAEAALPERWHVGELKNTAYRGDGERWLAMAWEFGDDPDYRTFVHGYGDTPVEALRALANRSSEAPR